LLNKTAKTAANKVLIRYLALSCTGEYAAERRKSTGNEDATMSRVNGIFNKDLAVRLVLIITMTYSLSRCKLIPSATTAQLVLESGGSDPNQRMVGEVIDHSFSGATGGTGCED
jgi:hypothetical protein